MPELFQVEPTPDRDTLQRTGNAYLNRLLANPAHEQVTLIKMTPALITGQTQDLAVTLPDGETAQFHLRDFTNITAGIDGWVGYKASDWKKKNAPASDTEIDNDPFYYLSVAREGDTLVGSLIVNGQPYRIDNIGAGQHVLIKVDESKLPKEAEPVQAPQEAGVVDSTIGRVPQSAHSTIRVMFLATNQRKAASPNYKLELANALNDANQYMINSRVNITYQLAGYYEGAYDESGRSYSQQLNDIGNAQPFAAQVLSRREALRADLVSMYSTASAYCGLAYRPASKATAHSVITCVSSLGHEMGHNLGATHNWEPGDAEGEPPYMYGYRYTGTPRFRTQMAYDCTSGGSCPRVAYHSNPRLTYQGVALGTAAHHDVARRFNERRETVEGFYPPVYAPITLTLYEYDFYLGRSCTMTLEHVDLKDTCLQARSARVQGAAPGSSVCIGNAQASNESCYSVETPNNDFRASNLDNPQYLPTSVRHSKYGSGAIGNANRVRYQVF